MSFYAAAVDYVLQDMRPCCGPFDTLTAARRAARQRVAPVAISGVEPSHEVSIGDYFAVDPANDENGFSVVLGPYKTKRTAERVRAKGEAAEVINGIQEYEFVGRVVEIIKRHPSGRALIIILIRS